MSRLFLALLLMATLLVPTSHGAETPFPPPQPANQLFQDRPFGPRPSPTPTPQRRKRSGLFQPKKEIPTKWIVTGGVTAALIIIAVLYGSIRRWRSSNLFDRQYRFRIGGEAAARFGAKKCGGHMASVRFGTEPRASPRRPSEAKHA